MRNLASYGDRGFRVILQFGRLKLRERIKLEHCGRSVPGLGPEIPGHYHVCVVWWLAFFR